MKKYILSVLALFSLNVLAEMGGAEASGFNGSFELKYTQPDLSENELGDLSYRVRAGWNGHVNDHIRWGLALSSNIEAGFVSLNPANVHLEQAYVKYAPMSNLSVKIGKYAKYANFASMGVFVDDDLYAEGVKVKFVQEVAQGTKVFAGASYEELDPYYGVWGADNSTILSAYAGAKAEVGDIDVKAKVGAQNNSYPNDGKVTLFNGKIHADYAAAGMPVGVFGFVSTNSEEAFKDVAYTGGVYVGDVADQGYSLGVSYYDISTTAWNTALVDTDYISRLENTKGVAVKAQYTVCDNTNLAVKYNYTLSVDDKDEKGQNVVAELTFDF